MEKEEGVEKQVDVVENVEGVEKTEDVEKQIEEVEEAEKNGGKICSW